MCTQRFLLYSCLLIFSQIGYAKTDFEIADSSREAFSKLLTVDAKQTEQALRGRALFRQSWVIAPTEDIDIAGLGPLYNQLSCLACHAKNGRGQPPSNPQQAMRSMLVRLSMAGETPHGAPLPHPVYGDQLNEQGIPNVLGEGRVQIDYQERQITLADGEVINLRIPHYQFLDLHYGALEPTVLFSPRISPPVFGMGLLEAVDDATLLQLVKNGAQQGVSGRVNTVWNSEQQRQTIGRFGLKANVATLKQQIAGAFYGDMGITSSLHPVENCTATQTTCQQAPSARQPELTDAQLNAVLLYLRLLQVPARRNVDDADVQQGEKLFNSIGCAACHVPTLKTGAFSELPMLSAQTIHPYSDLLLHDMGAELADTRPDFTADGQEWRTPPLWGSGLIERINEHSTFLHDGRARNLTEAVLWHGGEASTARQNFATLPSAQRQAIIRFLQSL